MGDAACKLINRDSTICNSRQGCFSHNDWSLREPDTQKYERRFTRRFLYHSAPRLASLVHLPRISGPSVDESPCEFLIRNVPVFDTSKRNRKETMTGWTDQIETLFAKLNFFHLGSDSWDDHESRTILFVATSACSGLRNTHKDSFNR